MSKSKGKGGRRPKGSGQGKNVPESEDPLNCEVDDLVLMMRQSDQSYETVNLAKHFETQAEELYPNLAKETITVPAIHVNKYKTKFDKNVGYEILVAPRSSDVRGDKAHVSIFHALYNLSQTLIARGLKPLFMINSYQYDSYLSRLKARWEKVKSAKSMDSPDDADEKDRDLPLPLPQQSGEKRGEVDMLVLQLGRATFIQAKSMGDNFDEWPEHMLAEKDTKIMMEVHDAFKQLDRDDKVFKVCMSKFYNKFGIVKIAAFPNLTWQQIQEANGKMPSILSDAGYSLDFQDHLILCKDNLQDMACSSQVIFPLVRWWLKYVEKMTDEDIEHGEPLEQEAAASECECDQSPLDPDGLKTLKNVVGRYLGFMSIVTINCRSAAKGSYVELRRFGQAVKYVSDEYSSITLTPEQVQMINSDVNLGFLSGPPGSGKTVVLAMKARSWILQTKNFVVNINMYRGACGRAIGKQTIKTICMHRNKNVREKLNSHCYELSIDVNSFDMEERKRHVQMILSRFKLESSERSRVMFLVDETYVEKYWDNVFHMLMEDFKDSPVWLAGLYGRVPNLFTIMRLTKVIRCPPMVQQLLKEVDWIDERRKCYSSENVRSTGTPVMAIRHRFHSQVSLHPLQCPDCAEDLIQCLDKFDVTKPASKDAQPHDLKANSLKCKDVCILINLPRALYLVDDDHFLDTSKEHYEAYMRSIKDCELFKRLESHNYPVEFHIDLPCRELVDDAENEEEARNVIKACWVFSFQGLENRVVFYFPGDPAMPENLNQLSEEEQAILTMPAENIPCPGYRTRNTEMFKADSQNTFDISISNVSVSREGNRNGRRGSVGPAQPDLRYNKEDIDRYTRWDKSILFISGSRCTGQLLLVIP